MATTLFSAAYLTRFGAKEQAIKLYRQAADIEPTRPEAYVLALRLARELKDYAAIAWAATGVLRTAWTKDHEQLHRDAEDAALDAERALSGGRQGVGGRRTPRGDGAGPHSRPLRAAAMGRRRRSRFVGRRAARHDLPRCQDPQSRGGGVTSHDGYGPDPKNCYEEYICALGMPGVYVVRVRRIDGTIVGKRAQLTVVLNQGAKNESTQTFVLKLDRRRRRRPHSGARTGAGGNSPRSAAGERQAPANRRADPASSGRATARPLDADPAGERSRRDCPQGAASVAGGGGVSAADAGIRGPVIGKSACRDPGRGVAGVRGLAVGYRAGNRGDSARGQMTAAAVVSADLRYVRLGGQSELLDNQRSLHVHLRRQERPTPRCERKEPTRRTTNAIGALSAYIRGSGPRMRPGRDVEIERRNEPRSRCSHAMAAMAALSVQRSGGARTNSIESRAANRRQTLAQAAIGRDAASHQESRLPGAAHACRHFATSTSTIAS